MDIKTPLMMESRRWPLLLLLLVASPDAYPAVYRVTASGFVSAVSRDVAGLLPFDQPEIGAALALTFTFDDSVPNQSAFPNAGLYVDDVSPLQLTVGAVDYALPSGAAQITIRNDCACIVVVPPGVVPQSYDDIWQVRQSATRPGSTIEESLSLFFFSPSLTLPVSPLGSTALVQPSPLAGWPLAQIIFQIEDTEVRRSGRFAEVVADVTELTVTPVPVPAALPLFLSSLVLLGVVSTSRRPA